MENISKNNIVFVGGGPVGLFAAIQAKLHNKKLNIVVLDKNDQYARTQPLRLESSSFWGMKEDDQGELKRIVSDFKKKKMVPIQEMVSNLKKYAQKLGIQFEQATLIADDIEEKNMLVNAMKIDEIVKKYSAGVVVGADGAHSTLRQVVFKDEFESDRTAEYLVQYTYCVKEKPKKMGKFESSVQKTSVGTMVEESFSQNNGRVNLRFFVDKKTFKSVEGAKAKEPWKLSDDRIPKGLNKNVEKWKARRKELFGEEEVDNPEDPAGLTAIKLKIYTTKQIVKQEKETAFCLVGDAASGIPYFRSINKGFKEAIQLGKAIAKAGDSETKTGMSLYWRLKAFFFRGSYSGQTDSQFKAYASFAKSNARWEAVGARIKTFFIDVFIGLLKIGGKIGISSLSKKASKVSVKRHSPRFV